MIGFENIAILALLILNFPIALMVYRREERSKKLIGIAKMLTFSLIIVAAATPFTSVQQDSLEEAEIVLLDDNSRSAELAEEVNLDLGDVKIRRKVISSGNQSDLRKGILRNLEPNTAYLLSSDLQSSTSLGGVAEKFVQQNSTLNALRTEMARDYSVKIEGPSSTVPGAENSFTVRTYATNGSVTPEVRLDGNTVALEKTGDTTWGFKRSFSQTGTHSIEASINVNDTFSSNNRFYRTVKVREKPEILIVGEEGRLGERLEKFYDVNYRNSIPDDLSEYYSVILKEDFNPSDVADYVSEGNGLIYTGDYDDDNYVLPVRPSDTDATSKGAKIMLVIDISKGTGDTTAHKKSVQIAYSLVDQLPYNNEVGAVAYNQDAYLLSKPKPLGQNRQELMDKLSRLESSGNSFHHVGLQGGKNALNSTGNIVLISDGKISAYGRNQNTVSKSKSIAANLDVRLITVGVGEDRNRDFLEDLADLGNGFYLDSGQAGRLNFVFEAGGAKNEANGLIVVDQNHFITKGIETSSRTAGFDNVDVKLGGDLLVTSNDGRPFLSTWRYGLGRVAAFSGGSSDLSRVLNTDPLLISRAVSWSVGAPQRKQENWINIEDGRRNQPVRVEASYAAEGLTRKGEDLYTTQLEPEDLGFHEFRNTIYAYNYNPEIERVGYSDQLEEITRKTGGQVYTPDEGEEIQEDLKSFKSKQVTTRKSLADYFLLAALLVFLGEIGYRKRKGMK